MGPQITTIILLLGLATSIYGHHFRGGSFHWRPLPEPNKVEVRYDLGFNSFRVIDPGEFKTIGHDVCREIGTDNLRTIGNLVCDECVGGTPYDYGLFWHCTDLNVKGDWDIGGKTFQVTVPDDTKKALMYYQVCCWVNPIQNVYPHKQLGWRMVTEIDLNPRNGRLNSSPITSPIPLQLFHHGCKYWLEIPVTDPDDDAYRCRYTDDSQGECYEGKRNTMCGQLDYITIFPNCTLLFDTTGPVGYYAVRVIIEDLDQSGVPLSKVSLSFLLNVSSDDATCKAPTILEPEKMCRTIQVDEYFQIDVVGQAATESLPIDRIESSKPSGMTQSDITDVEEYPLRKSVTLTWTPSMAQKGRHNIGFSAVDIKGFASAWSYITLNVVTGDELYPMPDMSDPSSEEIKTSLKKWTVLFNRSVRRPLKSAYITLQNEYGDVISMVDSSDSRQVKFHDNMIEFDVHLNITVEGTQSFHLRLSDGVAVADEPGSCILQSRDTSWTVYVEGNEPAITQTPITKLVPVKDSYKCTEGFLDIKVPKRVKPGGQCIVRPLLHTLSVTSRDDMMKMVNIPYEVCCERTCKKKNCKGKVVA